MKKSLIIAIIFMFFMVSYKGWGAECPSIGDKIDCIHCHAVPECCPPQDLVFQLSNGDYVTIPKGFFDDPNNYVTPEEHMKRIDKLIKDETI